jgi:hypothetical protein
MTFELDPDRLADARARATELDRQAIELEQEAAQLRASAEQIKRTWGLDGRVVDCDPEFDCERRGGPHACGCPPAES